MSSATTVYDEKTKLVLGKLNERLNIVLKNFEQTKQEALQKIPIEDCYAAYFRGKMPELKRLETEVLAFQNPERHFTKTYRDLAGQCQKMQEDFDQIKVEGRNQLKESKRQVSKILHSLNEHLESQLHESGNPCKQCELKS